VGYNVYRSLQKTGPFTLLNSSLVAATTYVDSTVISGATYYYVVTSVDSNGNESPPSNVSSDTIPFP
jgi:fibronectin type 3 domain-containing protein